MNRPRATSALATTISLAALLVGLSAPAQDRPAPPPAPAASAAPQAPQAPIAAPAPTGNAAVEEIIKLYDAKFSEDFIKRKIKNDGTAFNLSTSDLLRLKEAGIPEGLVETMMAARKASPEAPPAPAAPGASSAALAPPAPAATPAAPIGPPHRAWDGLVRRSSGSFLGFGYNWENGALRIENDQLKWIEAEHVERNLLVPVKTMTEQFLTCEKKPQGDCFEWGFKTKDGDFRFRDLIWRTGPSPKAKEIFDFMKEAYPNLASPMYPVDERK